MDVFTASLCAISAASSLTVRLKRSNRINLEAGGENYYPAKGAAQISNLLLLKAAKTHQTTTAIPAAAAPQQTHAPSPAKAP